MNGPPSRKGFSRHLWRNVLLVYDIDGYWKVTGKQSCGLMTKTLVEVFKGKAGIRYNTFDLSKNPQNNLTENLRNEVGSKYSSEYGQTVFAANCDGLHGHSGVVMREEGDDGGIRSLFSAYYFFLF